VEDDILECRISFNNTWGPTLLDGDDYFLGTNVGFNGGRNVYGGLAPLRPQLGNTATRTNCLVGGFTAWDNCDDFDSRFIAAGNVVNSLAEVEEAIRIGGQNFFAYYFDGAPFDRSAQGGQSTLTSYYFGYFPTKFFWFENGAPPFATVLEYLTPVAGNMLMTPKPLAVEVWDIFENSGGQSTAGCISPDPCGVRSSLVLGHELNFFDINFLKAPFNSGNVKNYKTGRVVISLTGNDANNPLKDPVNFYTWPGLFYTLEISDAFDLAHWRSMHRGL
jgi:hypothetical protein